MPALIYLPPAGETVMEGEIAVWHKNEGDKVEKNECICEVTTSKLNVEIEAPETGVVFKIFAPVGVKVPVGKVIAVIRGEDEMLSDADMENIKDRFIPEGEVTQPEKENATVCEKAAEVKRQGDAGVQVKISPIAKKIAAEKGLDISKINGTGPNDRITKEDVLSYEEMGKKAGNTAASEIAIEKLSGVRKIISSRLKESVQNKPHINFQAEVCMDELLKAREIINNKLDSKISINSFIIMATVKALKEYKQINAHIVDDNIMLYDDVHIGMAVGRDDKGLIVPVIKFANKMGIKEIDTEAKRLAELAREDKLQINEISGGTFTISNLGMFGISNFNAIINPPEVGILAVSSIIKKPVVKEEGISIANVMNINVAVDHSVVDGSMASRFAMRIKELLETPYMALIR